jgi:large subunit ribosomal protein L10
VECLLLRHYKSRFCFLTSAAQDWDERRKNRLAITREQKGDILRTYVDMLTKAKGFVVTEYRGMSMKNFNTLRASLRPIKGRYAVTKNTLFRLALQETGFAVPEDMLLGPIAVAIAYEDIGTVTKAILARAKEDELLVLKGAVMGQTIFRKDQLEALSTLPTLDEARATLIGTLQQPASRIIGLLTQPAQGLAALLQAYSDKQQGGETEAA